jgi:hypothetical protein
MNGVLDKLMLYSFENGSVTWSVDISFAQDQKRNLSLFHSAATFSSLICVSKPLRPPSIHLPLISKLFAVAYQP